MHRLLGTAEEREEREVWEVPDWSGVPVAVGNVLVVPLHCGDMRHLRMPNEWRHLGWYADNGGNVEYHFYERN